MCIYQTFLISVAIVATIVAFPSDPSLLSKTYSATTPLGFSGSLQLISMAEGLLAVRVGVRSCSGAEA